MEYHGLGGRPRALPAEAFVRQVGQCPSGRLEALDLASGDAEEPELEPSIVLVSDPAQGVAGPLWVRGGIEIVGGNGVAYERRNRVTLCRCGASQNKPFCDGSHASEDVMRFRSRLLPFAATEVLATCNLA